MNVPKSYEKTIKMNSYTFWESRLKFLFINDMQFIKVAIHFEKLKNLLESNSRKKLAVPRGSRRGIISMINKLIIIIITIIIIILMIKHCNNDDNEYSCVNETSNHNVTYVYIYIYIYDNEHGCVNETSN